MRLIRTSLASALLAAATNATAAPEVGPVVEHFGPVFAPPENAYNLVPGTHYKVSMDVSATGDFPEDRSRHLESAARFLNMHARNGIDPAHIDFALVVHGAATHFDKEGLAAKVLQIGQGLDQGCGFVGGLHARDTRIPPAKA